MRRPAVVWLIFVLCVALAATAVAWLGGTVLALERAELQARRQAALEENMQLALWRMDSNLAPLMAEESGRPYFAYSPLYPAERAFTRMFAEIQQGDVLVPSPLLTFRSPQIKLHFQYGPDGRISSPQVPAALMRQIAESRYLRRDQIEAAAARLNELGRLVSHRELSAAMTGEADAAVRNNALVADEANKIEPGQKVSNEYLMRSRSSKLAQNAAPAQAVPLRPRSPVVQGPLQPVWVGSALILARRVRVAEGTFLQGCWLDWDVVRNDLLTATRDLIPGARIAPVSPHAGLAPARMLASLPVRLTAEVEPGPSLSAWSPMRFSLLIAWGCLALAAAAVAILLRGTLVLSERRGTFVSAVTHELRTPLTTFRLYTEMLDEGMVADADSQRFYVKTLRAEADRLGRLVENVLAFARLERGRGTDGREVIIASELLEQVIPRLEARARQAEMELVVEGAETNDLVHVDVSVVDQILSNLLDNALKYAGKAEDRRIHVLVASTPRTVTISVRDHGPGLPPRAIRRLFRPFSKSAHDAAHSAPGVGLGLALSRRLARSLGGDLRLESNSAEGASFRLTLPRPEP